MDVIVGAGAVRRRRVVLRAVLVADPDAGRRGARGGGLRRSDGALRPAPGLGRGLGRRARLLRDDVDDAEGRVGAVQHGVGTAHDLDALHVLQLHRKALPVDASDQRIVDRAPVHEHQHLRDELLSEAARGDERAISVERVPVEHVHAGPVAQDVPDLLEAVGLDVGRGHHVDGRGRVQRRLGAARGGDDLRLFLVELEGVVRGEGRSSEREREGEGQWFFHGSHTMRVASPKEKRR